MRIRQFITAALCGLSLTTTSASHAAKDEVTVLLDWFINPDHAPAASTVTVTLAAGALAP